MADMPLQFVWWGWEAFWDTRNQRVNWPFVFFVRLDPEKTCLALIYRWALHIGPLEIRRWARG